MASWQPYLCDTVTGQIETPIDLPAFSWSVSVSDSSLATLKEKGLGDETISGLTVPWTSLPGDTPSARRRSISTDRTSVALLWKDADDDSLGRPILMGSIGVRQDKALDTSFTLNSPMAMLADRYVIREGKYGTGPNGTSPDVIALTGLSYRGIASEVGYLCTSCKPGGELPIDWTYRGEKGSKTRQYDCWDVQNLSCRDVLTKISNVIGGPDIQFRPYLTQDGAHIRYRFCAGSDADVYLWQDRVHYLSYGRDGGIISDLTVDHLGPVHRVYASGAGQDKTQKTVMVEDLTMLTGNDPWILHEATYSDSDTSDRALLREHALSYLAANDRPLIQITCTINAHEHTPDGLPKLALGTFWPGELFDLAIDDYAPLPDGIYRTRLMQMSGDQTGIVKLTFDAMADPTI